MTISNKITPANVLALYTWEVLKNNTAMQMITTPSGPIVPIVPFSDEARVHDSTSPYLIYGYSEQFSEGQREIRQGVFSLRACTRTAAELNDIINVISRAFEKGDDSAANVNLWSSTNDALIGIRFTTLDTLYIEGGEISESEGGPVYGLINIGYRYVTHADVKEFKFDGTWA